MYKPLSIKIHNAVLLIVGLFIFASCTIKVMHYYPEGQGIAGEDIFDKMISTQDLGVGYDLVWADPEDWAKNSVQGAGVRPKVFEFQPDLNSGRVIDIPQLEGPATRKILPKGVFAETNARFKWSDEMRFVYSATDFRDDYSGSFSASGGASVASFTASAAFSKTDASTTEEKKSFAYKDGAFRGLKMEIEPSFAHEFTPQFQKAVRQLDSTNAADFIKAWGTHYSQEVTIGARCAYRFEHSYLERSAVAGNSVDFELSVEGGVGALEVGVGASYGQSTMSSVKTATGTQNIDFVSYGGSGAGIDDFGTWSNHAVNNPTVVDVYLESYEALLNARNFPNDPLIVRKRNWLNKALASHFEAGKDKTTGSAKTFDYPKKDGIFEMKVVNLRHMMIGDNYETDYSGSLSLLPVDRNYTLFGPLDMIKPRNQNYINKSAGGLPAWFAKGESTWRVTNGGLKEINKSYIIQVDWDQMATGFVSLIGIIEERWAGKSPLRSKVETDNRILFSEVEVGDEVIKEVDFMMNKEKTKVLTVTAEIRLKRIE